MENRDHEVILKKLEIRVEKFIVWCRSIRTNITDEMVCEQASTPPQINSNEIMGTLPENKAKFVVASADEFCEGKEVENEF